MKDPLARLWQIVDVPRPGDRASRIFDWALMALITANVAAMVSESVPSIGVPYAEWFYAFEAVSVALFTVEWLARIAACVRDGTGRSPVLGRLRFALKPMMLIDLLAFAPFYLPFIGVDLRVARSLRLFRVFRLLKLGRYSAALQTLGTVLHKTRAELSVVLTVLVVMLLIASTLMYHVENAVQPDGFPSIPAAMWWGIATLTTVGYGDIYPVTVLGRLLGSVIAVLGIGMFALPTGILSAAFLDELRAKREGS